MIKTNICEANGIKKSILHVSILPNANSRLFYSSVGSETGLYSRRTTNKPLADFKVVLIEHGYETSEYERRIIEDAGGALIDCEHCSTDDALKEAEDADGIIFRRIEMNRTTIERFKKARIILRYGIGTDNVNLDACTDMDIIAGHVPGYCIDDVSTHAVALLTACVRNIVGNQHAMNHGAWDLQRTNRLFRTEGRTLGIIGLGGIGQSLSKKLSGWGFRLVAADPFVEPELADKLQVKLMSLDELLAVSDYISLHAPLLPETHHLLDHDAFSRMKPGVMVINTARGPLICQEALLHAIECGIVSRAGIDVFEDEPLSGDSPMRNHPQIVVSDHTAWYSEESQVILQKLAAEEIVRVCRGELPFSLANVDLVRKSKRFKDWEPPDMIRWQLKRLDALQLKA